MTTKFYDNKGILLLTYTGYSDAEEIQATKELLEYENNCIVTVIKAD